MPINAGYAAAIVIRDRVLDDALLSAYRGGAIRHSVVKSFGQVSPPRGSVNLFFASPRVVFSNADQEHAILRFSGWGTIGVRVDFAGPIESRSVQWHADLRLTATPTTVGTIVLLSADSSDYRLVDWELDVLSGVAFSAVARAYLDGDAFKGLLEAWLREAIGDLLFPVIDFGFLGPFSGTGFTDIAVKVVDDAVILGFDMDDGEFSTAGDRNQLADFAGTNDVAVAVHPGALEALMPTAEQQIQDRLEEYDATLESLSITCETGRFRVTGRASATGGATNFTFAVVPRMVASRPGAYIPLAKKTMVVKARSWPALSFAATEPEVDVDRSWWVTTLVEGLLGVVTLGFMPFAVEAFIASLVRNIGGAIETADVNPRGPMPLVRRFGDPPTRFAIETFAIHPTGILIGISSRLEAPKPYLSGLKSIPRTFAGRTVRYEVQLPFEALPADPFLRIRWTVVDLDSGSVVHNDDGPAAGRQRLEFVPAALGAQVQRFAVACRVYRALGPFAVELLNETIRLDLGAPPAPGAFVRWRYDVKNPQIALDETTEEYHYRGDVVVRRWSKFHRADRPCANAQRRSRYVYSDEALDDLPFPIEDVNGNRYRLCDYCFFGGPASQVASL
jgi:hypothetical protein